MKLASHTISIPSLLEVGTGTFSNAGAMLKKTGISAAAIVFGEGIKELFGQRLIDSLNESGVNILNIIESDNIEIENIIKAAFSISPQVQAIIGAGGGKALDTAKYISFLNDMQFISIPTSTSNDGFSSSTCSLIIDGKRKTVPAKMPYGIIVDIDVIKSSPEKFIFSGIGDLVSKIPALRDWSFEEENGKALTDGSAVMIAKKSVNSFIRYKFKDLRDTRFLKELVDSLVMSGMSVEIAGNSAPASGSEHLISHALDKIVDVPQLHGIQVGVASYLMSRVQKYRYRRVAKVLWDTGFFSHVKGLGMKASDFRKAIDLAPSIKPDRYTYIHVEKNRECAKALLSTDKILKEILVQD